MSARRMTARMRRWCWRCSGTGAGTRISKPSRCSIPRRSARRWSWSTPTRFKATLTEPPIPGDASSARTANALPAYVAYQGDGDVTAPLVYVNYGMKDDYDALERLGVSVKGKIVIARYGEGWRGLKPKLAQEHGAVGCIIYSDPRDDGYSAEDAYPKGPARPPQGIPARLGRRHDALSRRSADARHRRDGECASGSPSRIRRRF